MLEFKVWPSHLYPSELAKADWEIVYGKSKQHECILVREEVLLSFKETMGILSPHETFLNPNFVLGKISRKIVEKVFAFCHQRALNETALIVPVNDLWRKQDGNSVFILAAFDTIKSGILLDQLQELGIGTLFYAASQPSSAVCSSQCQ